MLSIEGRARSCGTIHHSEAMRVDLRKLAEDRKVTSPPSSMPTKPISLFFVSQSKVQMPLICWSSCLRGKVAARPNGLILRETASHDQDVDSRLKITLWLATASSSDETEIVHYFERCASVKRRTFVHSERRITSVADFRLNSYSCS